MMTMKKNKRFSIFLLVCFCVLFLYCVIMFSMLGWTIMNSFKDEFSFMDDPLAFPTSLNFSNYYYAIKNLVIKFPVKADIIDMFVNSILYAVGCSLTSTFVIAVVAYVTSMYKDFLCSKVIYAIVLFAMVFPIIGSQASELQIVTKLGLRNHMWGMYILKFNFLSFYFLIAHAAFRSVSKVYKEAAVIDGANNFKIMFKIYFPQVIPLLSTIFLLNFVAYWNDYQTPLLYLSAKPTISYGLYLFCSNGGITTPAKFAACLIVMIPMLIIFIIFRKKLMGKLAMDGGIKG